MLYRSQSIEQHLLVDSFPCSYLAAFPRAAGAVTLALALQCCAARLWKPVERKDCAEWLQLSQEETGLVEDGELC